MVGLEHLQRTPVLRSSVEWAKGRYCYTWIMRCRLALAVACALVAAAQPADSQERSSNKRLVGVVLLPEVFGTPTALDGVDTVPRRASRSASLRERPSRSAPVVATISGIEDVAVVEAGYEIPAAEVYDRQGSWLLLRTSKGVEGWIEERFRGRYYSIESLLRDGLLYLTGAADGRIFDAPNGKRIAIPENPDRRVVGVLSFIAPRVRSRGTRAEATRRGCDFSGRVNQSEGVLDCPPSIQVTLYTSPSSDAPIHSTFNTAAENIPLQWIGEGYPVFDSVRGWYQVALQFTSVTERAWMQEGPAFQFHPAESREKREDLASEVWPETLGVDLRETRQVDGMLWLRIDVHSTGACSSDGPDRVLASGWIPAYTSTNDLTMWFYARGC